MGWLQVNSYEACWCSSSGRLVLNELKVVDTSLKEVLLPPPPHVIYIYTHIYIHTYICMVHILSYLEEGGGGVFRCEEGECAGVNLVPSCRD